MFTKWQGVVVQVVAGAILIGSVVAVHGADKPKPEKFTGSGIIEAIGPGVLQANIGGQPWLIKPSEKCKLTVKGTAEADFLRAGLFVRVSGEFDKKGKAAAPIGELEIVTPSASAVPGIVGGGLGPTAVPAGGFGEGEPKPAAAPANVPTALVVTGRIASIKNGELTVSAGNGSVRFTLTDAPTIKVNAADIGFARIGDAVDVKNGGYFQPGRALAEEMTISLVTPLSAPKKRLPIKPGEKPGSPSEAPPLKPFLPPEEAK